MVGALMGSLAVVFVAEGQEQVPVVRTVFTQESEKLSALLLWIPYALSLSELRK